MGQIQGFFLPELKKILNFYQQYLKKYLEGLTILVKSGK